MSKINIILTKQIKSSIKELFNLEIQDIHLEHPKDNTHGDFSTNIALNYARHVQKNPREFAEILKDDLIKKLYEYVNKIEIAGPGFINFYLNNNFFIKELNNLFEKETIGNSNRLAGKKVMIEFAHPNPFKSFHIGHLRNIILGESLVRLTESQGAQVIRINYQGDVGMHIAKCLWAFKDIPEENYPQDNNKKVQLLGECYAKGATAFEQDDNIKKDIVEINKKIYSSIKKTNNNNELTTEEKNIYNLWFIGRQWSLDKFRDIYKRVYSDKFTKEYMESEVMETCLKYIDKALEKNILKKSQGAIVFDGKEYGLDTRVFLNSEGLPTYEGKELGLAYKEFTEWGEIDLCIHNVAVEQISFFKVTFKVQELLDPKLFKNKQYHNAYEFVGLKHGKMSSRKGNVVLGEDILDLAEAKIKNTLHNKNNILDEESIKKIAIAAVKYSFLKISPFTYLSFDIEESVNLEGDSGPYIQYTSARTKSIIRKSENQIKKINNKISLNHEELEILKLIYQFDEVVEKASIEYSPNLLCTYLYNLTQAYNKFYNLHQILDDVKSDLRINLTRATSMIIDRGLYLLGIKSVEKM